jgi:hypothetical protein
MRFVLSYTGPLASNGGPDQKHAIRRYFSPQLKEQWQIDHALINLANARETVDGKTTTGLERIAADFVRGPFHFVPGDSGEGDRGSGLIVISIPGDVINRRSEATLAGRFCRK